MTSPQWMFEGGMKIDIYHTPSRDRVEFKSWITDYEDRFTQEWEDERVFGRNDKHQVFKGTDRVISIAYKVLAEDIYEASENMKKISKLAQMQYPVYNSATGTGIRGVTSATAIQASPVFKMKFMNWLGDQTSFPRGSAKTGGLVGTMRGFSFKPNMEGIFFHHESVNVNLNQEAPNNFPAPYGQIYPAEIDVAFEFHVLHSKMVGYGPDRKFRAGDEYPYGDSPGGRGSNNRLTDNDQVSSDIQNALLDKITGIA